MIIGSIIWAHWKLFNLVILVMLDIVIYCDIDDIVTL